MYRLILPALLAAVLLPAQKAAAETNDCTPIVSLPATITSQGIYCLTGDLNTAITTGGAITLANNNITLDCNGFKVGGLPAGSETRTTGIRAINRSNITIRNCNVRGFLQGIMVYVNENATQPSAGQVVEDNRLDGNTARGIFVDANASVIRRNRISDTGGNPHSVAGIGITAFGGTDVIDNIVDGVIEPSNVTAYSYGVWIRDSTGTVISGNRVRHVQSSLGSIALGNWGTQGVSYRGNLASSPIGEGNNIGFACSSTPESVKIDNVAIGFQTAFTNCVDSGGNQSLSTLP